MSFQPTIPLAGIAGWRFLERTQEAQKAAFEKGPALQREIAHFMEKIGSVTSAADLVADRRSEPPILLLDEVAAHLDPRRRAALFARLEGRGQVWMTATEAALFDGIWEATRLHVEGGAVNAI